MQLDPEALDVRSRYALMIGTIQPRPIAWVSTIGPDGASNIAPFSFFTGLSANPMTLCFCPVNDRHGKKKDTLVNIETTRQFVVNFATEKNAAKMNATSAPFAYGVSEFERCGVTPLPSIKVKPPRAAESPVAFECELHQVVRIGEGPLAANLVIGKVVHIHCDERLYVDGKIRHQDLRAVGRMEGDWYSRTQDAFELPRPEAS
jgi:flavin reductase (DIM6/NTAB) family NADH-FMN oxidoreductase RutF